jgi:uncharacterized membrane protein YhaH (DUF805 family)
MIMEKHLIYLLGIYALSFFSAVLYIISLVFRPWRDAQYSSPAIRIVDLILRHTGGICSIAVLVCLIYSTFA